MLSSMAVHFGNWMAHHTKDNFGFLEKHRQIAVPALSITGWYDQQIGTIRQFTGMVENGMTEHARSNQHLIIGPWGHTLHMTDDWDWIDFGPDTSLDFVEMADLWLKRWSTGEPNQVDDWPPIRLFVMGANHWRNEQEWPLARTVYTDFFLSSNGSANTATGDGKLSREHPHDEPNDRFRYDPRDPVMTLYTPEGQHAPFDQRPLDARGDILNYTTAPLEEPLETTGPVVVTLWASSSALDTDFVAKLTDVWPDGFVQELCYGIVRARYRDSLDAPSLLEPGRPYEFTINLNPTSNLFKAGHRIRLAISSSDFPSFDRNHNTGGDDYADPLLLTAEQTVFHDSSRPSKIVLPVIR
jgi:hypothetical protein